MPSGQITLTSGLWILLEEVAFQQGPPYATWAKDGY